MRKLTLKKVEPLVRQWQARLGLQDYLIDVAVEELAPNTYAATAARDDSVRARILFNTEFSQVDETSGSIGSASLEETVIHELLHVALARMRQYILRVTEEDIGGPVGITTWERIRDEEEMAVDRLSVALHKTWPR